MVHYAEEQARAKINLTLDVLYRREDGYHEVEMVMQTVDLCDRLRFESIDGDRIELQSNLPYLPTDERNLAYRAAQLLRQHSGVRHGVRITLDKHIPVAAGLAGGSSDAAATLRGLNHLWRLELSTEDLAALGQMIGSDVPFCIEGGTALATGRGERLTPLPDASATWVVLAKPPISVSTAEVYRRFQPARVSRRPHTTRMIEALSAGDMTIVGQEMCNVLESVTLSLYPEVANLKRRMSRFGAMSALMSGSGPTVFAIVDREQRARRIYHALRGYLHDVHICRFVGRTGG